MRGWNYDGASLSALSKVSFFAFGTLRYGASAATGDVDGDGYGEILAAPGPGAIFGAQVRGFDYDATAVTALAKVSFFAVPSPPAQYGATVACSDVESDGYGGFGDGYGEIVVGRGPDPAQLADVTIVDYDDAGVTTKRAVADACSGTHYGVIVAGGDVDAGDTREIATSPGPDPSAAARILCWEWNPKLGRNPSPSFEVIGTDDVVAFAGRSYGANIAIGTFE